MKNPFFSPTFQFRPTPFLKPHHSQRTKRENENPRGNGGGNGVFCPKNACQTLKKHPRHHLYREWFSLFEKIDYICNSLYTKACQAP